MTTIHRLLITPTFFTPAPFQKKFHPCVLLIVLLDRQKFSPVPPTGKKFSPSFFTATTSQESSPLPTSPAPFRKEKTPPLTSALLRLVRKVLPCLLPVLPFVRKKLSPA